MKLSELRRLYSQAEESSTKTELFLRALKHFENQSSQVVVKAYQAAGVALRAKESWFPFEKLSLIRESVELFKKAVALDPESVEVRFVRFSIEVNTPFVLGMSQHLQEDHSFIAENLAQEAVPNEMRPEIAKYLLKKNYGSAEELKQLKTYLTN